MFTLRCTQKLLSRLNETEEPQAPTTILGDWHANILVTRPKHLVLCISERSLLPVVVPLTEIETLGLRLATAVSQVLLMIGVPVLSVEKERNEMGTVAYGRTNNRRVLGTINTLMLQLRWYINDRPTATLLEQSLYLVGTPLKPLGYQSPNRFSVDLFRGLADGAGKVQ